MVKISQKRAYVIYERPLKVKKSLRNVRNLTEKLALREYGQFFIHLCHSLVLLTMPFFYPIGNCNVIAYWQEKMKIKLNHTPRLYALYDFRPEHAV